MKQNEGYHQIFHERLFMQNTIANFINRIGDSIDMIAFSWLIFQLTGSASWSAIMLGVNMLPTVFIQPFAGALVEHLSKKKIIVLCDVGRGFLTFLIAILFLMGALNPWLLLSVTFLNNTLEAFRNPANTAFLPMILSKEHYEFGVSFTQTSSRLCELIGVGIAGVIIAKVGVGGAILIDVFSFFICAIIMALIPIKETRQEKGSLNLSSYMQSLKEGFQYMKTMPILLMLCVIALLINAILVPFNSFLTPYISAVLQQDAELLSFCNILLTCALLLGAFIYPYLHKRVCNRTLFLLGILSSSVFYFTAYGVHSITDISVLYCSLGIASIIFGFGIALLNSIASIAVMQKVEQAYLARFSSVFGAIAAAAMPVTSFIMSAVSTTISVVDVFLYTALFTIIAFIGMMFIKLLRQL